MKRITLCSDQQTLLHDPVGKGTQRTKPSIQSLDIIPKKCPLKRIAVLHLAIVAHHRKHGPDTGSNSGARSVT